MLESVRLVSKPDMTLGHARLRSCSLESISETQELVLLVIKKKALHDHNNYNGGLDLDVAHHQSHAHSLDRIKRGKGILV